MDAPTPPTKVVPASIPEPSSYNLAWFKDLNTKSLTIKFRQGKKVHYRGLFLIIETVQDVPQVVISETLLQQIPSELHPCIASYSPGYDLPVDPFAYHGSTSACYQATINPPNQKPVPVSLRVLYKGAGSNPKKVVEIHRFLSSRDIPSPYIPIFFSAWSEDFNPSLFEKWTNDTHLREPGPTLFSVTEFFPWNLEQFIARHTLNESDILVIVYQIAKGIEFLQQHGVVHRHLKIQNMLINETGRVVISDFGHAYQFASTEQGLKVQYDELQMDLGGAMFYLPPEIRTVKQGLVDYSTADTYALGMSIYALFNISPPYLSDNATPLPASPSLQQLVLKMTQQYVPTRFAIKTILGILSLLIHVTRGLIGDFFKNLALLKSIVPDSWESLEPAILLEYLKLLVEKKQVEAAFLLGKLYFNGEGVPKDEKIGFGYFKNAVEWGQEGKYALQLAECYLNGLGVEKDETVAIGWYEKAAAMGHLRSLFIMGERYEKGQGVTKDEKKAFGYYERAIDLGKEVQFKLGLCYFYGKGTKQDEEKGMEYLSLAARAGHVRADDVLEDIHRKLIHTNNPELKLTRKYISRFEPNVFQGVHKLNFLQIIDNPLAELPPGLFNPLVNLKLLEIEQTEIKILPSGIFRSLRKLEKLVLTNTPLKSLPQNIFNNLASLNWLEVSFSQITEIPQNTFENNTNLKTLILSGNLIDELRHDLFRTLTGLQSLDLQNNKIQELPYNIFHSLTGLTSLAIQENPINYLPTDLLDENRILKTFSVNSALSKEYWVNGFSIKNLKYLKSQSQYVLNLRVDEQPERTIPCGCFGRTSFKMLKHELTMKLGLSEGTKFLIFKSGILGRYGLVVDIESLESVEKMRLRTSGIDFLVKSQNNTVRLSFCSTSLQELKQEIENQIGSNFILIEYYDPEFHEYCPLDSLKNLGPKVKLQVTTTKLDVEDIGILKEKLQNRTDELDKIKIAYEKLLQLQTMTQTETDDKDETLPPRTPTTLFKQERKEAIEWVKKEGGHFGEPPSLQPQKATKTTDRNELKVKPNKDPIFIPMSPHQNQPQFNLPLAVDFLAAAEKKKTKSYFMGLLQKNARSSYSPCSIRKFRYQ